VITLITQKYTKGAGFLTEYIFSLTEKSLDKKLQSNILPEGY